MDKKTVLKAFYISQINELIEQCEDISTLELIFILLNKQMEVTH